MIPVWLIYGNLAWYLVLTVAFAYHRAWGVAVYFGGAAVLTVGVILMAKGGQ
mgnify:CR=1 FL=1